MEESLTDLCKRLEFFETPEWAVQAILEKEIMPHSVLDPCVGTGILLDACKEYPYKTYAQDIHDWGYPDTRLLNFFDCEYDLSNYGILVNPPFSEAVSFITRAQRLNAKKIVCFQRFSWWESQKRRAFWDEYPPNRIYVCGDRATCWRHDVPPEERVDEKGRKKTTPTAHAWFVWEKGHPTGTLLGHIYKGKT